jgi:DNA-binding MarR family transcriptional regulator
MSTTKRSDAEILRQLIRTFVRRFGLLDQNHTPCGLPMAVSDAHALVEMLRSPGLEPLKLSRRLGLSKSAVSRLLLRLKRRGQITQQRDRNDGRVFNLYLTEKGKRTANLINRESITLFGSILSKIREDDVKLILGSLPLLIQAIPEPRSDSDSG